VVASADPSGLGLRPIAPEPALQAVAHPAPPARPFAVAALARVPEPAAAPAVRTPEPAATSEERAALRALFAAATPASPAAPARVAAARSRPGADAPSGFVADAGPSLAMGFSSQPAADLQPDRFTGPAVRPLPVRR
jgi:hypothetical protein